MRLRPLVLVLGLLAAGCYRPSVADCAIECTADPECPGAMVCAHQRCRPAGLTEACLVADPDAAAVDAARSDAPACVDSPGCRAFTCPGSASCYLECAEEISWSNAVERCAELGGCLVQLDSPGEVGCVGEETSEGQDQPWTAGRQAAGEDTVDGGWSWRSRAFVCER